MSRSTLCGYSDDCGVSVDVRRISNRAWRCDACGEELLVRRGRTPVGMRVTEPDNFQTRVVTVNGAVVHQCRHDARLIAGQLTFALA